MGNIKLAYRPLKIEDGISKQDYVDYHEKPGQISIAKLIAIEPLEEAMKKKDKEKFEFEDFSVSRKLQKRDSASWKGIFDTLSGFLEIRADDSRVFDMDGVKPFEGIGYCMLISDLKNFIDRTVKEKTSHSEYWTLGWPRMKKGEEVREIVIPVRNYSVINEENAKIVREAKKFCSGLEKEVVGAFKQANIDWFEKETGYCKEKLPSKEESPVQRLRELEGGRYVAVSLVREEEPEYQQVVEFLQAELQDLENGVALDGYKIKNEREGVYVNIKNVQERISWERLEKDKLIKVKGRYEIAP